MLISESTAKAFFPGQDPIGKRFKAASFNANQPNLSGAWRTVIGVVGNVRYKGLHEVQLDMDDPPSQTTVGTTTSLVVRLKAGEERNALGVAAAIQTQARQDDPRALVSGIMMLEDVVNKEIAPWRFSAWVFALFAALAFGLAMLGLFSLVALDVSNRRREFAIRMAVGATGGDIVGGVFRSAAARAGLGIVGGLLVAAVATRSLETLLFGVQLVDVLTYGTVVALVAVAVAVASYYRRVELRRRARYRCCELSRSASAREGEQDQPQPTESASGSTNCGNRPVRRAKTALDASAVLALILLALVRRRIFMFILNGVQKYAASWQPRTRGRPRGPRRNANRLLRRAETSIEQRTERTGGIVLTRAVPRRSL